MEVRLVLPSATGFAKRHGRFAALGTCGARR
jgi:hypothetical protein